MSCQPELFRELGLWAQGLGRIAGLDEAGRGAWAGPVVAAAVVLPPGRADLHVALADVRDSKLLTPRQRERCYTAILAVALSWGVGVISSTEIDSVGIVPATRLAMRQAIEQLDGVPDHLLIDALRLPGVPIAQTAWPKADLTCLSVAAASILAKVTRDRLMIALDEQLPGYGLAHHKGYGTAEHQRALEALGPSSHHRHTFAPIRVLEQSWAAPGEGSP